MTTIARLTAIIDANTSGFDKGIKTAEEGLKNVETQANKAGAATGGIGDSLSKLVASGVIAQVGQGISQIGQQGARLFAGAIASSMDYEKVMSTVKAVSGANAEQMAKLSTQAMKLGKDTIFSAKEAANAQSELLKGNVSLSDVLGGALKGTLSLASAGELGVADAAKIAANAMNTFGLKGKDVSHVADVLATAANKSTGEVADFAIGLGQAGAAAHTAGMSLDQTGAVLALFANKGLQASDAGTSLKTFLEFLIPKSKQAGDTMKALGLSFFDASGHMRSVSAIAQQLQDHLAGLSQQNRMAAVNTIFGSDASRAATILMEAGAKGVDGMTAALSKKGEADRIAAEKQNNLAGAVENFKGSVETAGIAIGTALTPAIEAVTNNIKSIVDSFNSLPAPAQKFIAIGGAIAAGVAVVAGGLISFAASAAGLAVSLEAMGLTAGAAAAAVGAIALPVAAVVAGVALLALAWKNDFGSIREVAAQVGADVMGFVNSQFGFVVKWFQTNMPLIREVVKTVLTTIEQFWHDHGTRIMAIITPLWDFIKTAFSAAIHIILDIVKLGMDVLAGHWGAAAKDIGGIVTNLWAVLRSLFQNGVKVIGNILAGLVEVVMDIGKRLFEAALNAGQQVINGITGGIKGGIGSVVAAAKSLAASIPTTVAAHLLIQSPSRVMNQMGRWTAEGLAQGMRDNTISVAQAADAMGEAVKKHVKTKLTEAQKEMRTYVLEMAREQATLAALRSGKDSSAAATAGQFRDVPGAAALANLKDQIAHIKQAESQQRSFNIEMAKTKAMLKEILAGGNKQSVQVAGRFDTIPKAQQDHLADLKSSVAALNGLDKLITDPLKHVQQTAQKIVTDSGQAFASTMATAVAKVKETSKVIKDFNAEMDAKVNAAHLIIAGNTDPVAEEWQTYLANHGALAQAISGDAAKAAEEFGKFKQALELSQQGEGLTQVRNMLSDIARSTAEMQAKNPFEAFKIDHSVANGMGGFKLPPGITEADLKKVFDAQKLNLQIGKTKEAISGMVQDVSGIMEGGLSALFQNGFQGFFSSVIQGFEKMFQNIAMQYLESLAVNALLGAIGGTSMQDQYGSGGSGGGILGAIFGGARAAGGPVTGGVPYLVGEKGPELIVPGSSGTVIPNHQLVMAGAGSGSGGGKTTNNTQNYNISVTVPSSGGNTAQDRRSGQQIAQEVYKQMVLAHKRNG